MYGEYQLAVQACNNAQNAWEKANANINGDDAGMIQAEIAAMNPLITPDGTLYPGLNMAISDAPNGTVTGQFKMAVVPYYSMPSLNSTLTVWQTAPDDAPPTLTWNSTTSLRISLESSESSSVSVHYLWNKVGASQNSNMSFVATETASTLISFGGMELITVERGAWFDDFNSATAVGNPSTTDPLATAHKAAFATYFGTPQSPGPASTYNDKALVVYKPKAVFKYADTASYQAAKSAQASASVSGGLWGASGSGQSSSSNTDFNDEALELSFTPNSKNAYIVGYVMRSYWDDSTSATNTRRRDDTHMGLWRCNPLFNGGTWLIRPFHSPLAAWSGGSGLAQVLVHQAITTTFLTRTSGLLTSSREISPEQTTTDLPPPATTQKESSTSSVLYTRYTISCSFVPTEQQTVIGAYKRQFNTPPTDPNSPDFPTWAVNIYQPFASAYYNCISPEKNYKDAFSTTGAVNPPSAASAGSGGGSGVQPGGARSCVPQIPLLILIVGTAAKLVTAQIIPFL
ncbi:hypothetical protein DFH09DRAFT_1478572 [Mycena vulgaris]|nr:hypothetical protein DFH09DRAFT_1478572 [Mycena vulgaris]